jgi:hypothetical protein
LSKRSARKKSFRRNSKGFSGILATIFLVIIVLFLYSSVFVFMQNQNARFEEGARNANQMDRDLDQERLSFANLTYTTQDDKVYLQTQVTNEGPVPIEVITLWTVDKTTQNYGYNDTITFSLNSGETINLTGSNAPFISIENMSPSSEYTSWFITARGNRIPVETHLKNIVVANVAKGIGAIAMDLNKFRHFLYNGTNALANFSDGINGFDVPQGINLAFGVFLTNYDEQERPITIDSHSLMLQTAPGGNEYTFYIVNVATNGSILSQDMGSFTNITLNFGDEKMLVFASSKDLALGSFSQLKVAVSVDMVATFLLLHGKIGSTPYAQNIPYVSLFYD